ncbi:N-acetylglucosaminyl transferase component-domain-containing protein [Lipomyces oligophaga]|uniref:N-acetylglucosaminyl transferase component-domain-containing protein n=1 Tax=Lipomyces oligophaga TaxID=45792 RepID=UPI0034CFAF21
MFPDGADITTYYDPDDIDQDKPKHHFRQGRALRLTNLQTADRDGFGRRRKSSMHINLPANQHSSARVHHAGTTISGARSVPVSSASSPTDESPTSAQMGEMLNRRQEAGHFSRNTSGTVPRISNSFKRATTAQTVTYRVGDHQKERIQYDYDQIFGLREKVWQTVKEKSINPTVLRVFWPSNYILSSGSRVVIVGFQNSASEFVVVGLYKDIEVSEMQSTIDRYASTILDVHRVSVGSVMVGDHMAPDFGPVVGDDGQILESPIDLSKLTVLGTLNSNRSDDRELPLFGVQGGMDPWPQFYPSFIRPGSSEPVSTCNSFQVILYFQPISKRLQYISFLPITLELADRSSVHRAEDEASADARKRQLLISTIERHTRLGFPVCRSAVQANEGMDTSINEINIAYELGLFLRDAVQVEFNRPDGSELTWTQRLTGGFRRSISKILGALGVLSTVIGLVSIWLLLVAIMSYRILSEFVLIVIEWYPKTNIPALREISATVQQLDLRLQQACYWPVQYMRLHKQKRKLSIRTAFNPEYIRFYNSLWLVANDIIIGAAVGAYMIENREYIVSFIEYCINETLTKGLRRTIEWLMDWPGGLKLNNELVAFFGELFLWVIEFWGGLLRMLQPLLPGFVYLAGLSGFVGATFSIALIADIISFMTIQIYSCYVASARIYNWQLTVLGSLFHLFRGKRRNVLRNRIDSVDYDLDQLLLGTLLFTLLVFLIPTVLVFYLTFASARLGIIVLNAVLESSLALLNHFPLFAIMLRLKDSKRLPGGLEYSLKGAKSLKSSSDTATAVYLELRPVALPVSAMFQQYLLLCKRIQRYYLSLHVVGLLLTGQFVPIQRSRLYSLQYSMLPERRIGIRELWDQLRTFRSEIGKELRARTAAVWKR